jgi:hypothetical protein
MILLTREASRVGSALVRKNFEAVTASFSFSRYRRYAGTRKSDARSFPQQYF